MAALSTSAGREVVVVEAEDAIGTGVSFCNSEVIQAGISYPTRLAKKAMLDHFCREYGIQHRGSGKLIVAAEGSEIAELAALEAQAKANGVDDLLWLCGTEARALEPVGQGNRALLSPSSGIVGAQGRRGAWSDDCATPVVSGRAHGDGV